MVLKKWFLNLKNKKKEYEFLKAIFFAILGRDNENIPVVMVFFSDVGYCFFLKTRESY